MERHSKHPHTPSGWRRIILFPFFPLSSVLSKRALIFLGFLGHHTPGTASRYPSWASRRLGPVAESLRFAFYSIGRLEEDTGGFLVFCVDKRRRSNAQPPLTLGRDPRQFVFFWIFFLVILPVAYDAREAGRCFLFWAGSVVERYPPLPLAGMAGWHAWAATDRARVLGHFVFLFLSHGCMVTALMTDIPPPSPLITNHDRHHLDLFYHPNAENHRSRQRHSDLMSGSRTRTTVFDRTKKRTDADGVMDWREEGGISASLAKRRGTERARRDRVPDGLSLVLAAMAVQPRHLASRGRPGAEADTGCRQEREGGGPKEEGVCMRRGGQRWMDEG